MAMPQGRRDLNIRSISRLQLFECLHATWQLTLDAWPFGSQAPRSRIVSPASLPVAPTIWDCQFLILFLKFPPPWEGWIRISQPGSSMQDPGYRILDPGSIHTQDPASGILAMYWILVQDPGSLVWHAYAHGTHEPHGSHCTSNAIMAATVRPLEAMAGCTSTKDLSPHGCHGCLETWRYGNLPFQDPRSWKWSRMGIGRGREWWGTRRGVQEWTGIRRGVEGDNRR